MCFMSQRERVQQSDMSRYRDDSPAVRVYTVCDESKYLIVRNVPALGCGDELSKLFGSYGEIEECKPKDDEDCEPFTDVYWIKFYVVNNARFAKRKLDEFVFLGNRLQVSYAPHYESLSDTKDKLEGRRKEVLARLNPGRSKPSVVASPPETRSTSQLINSSQRDTGESQHISHSKDSSMTRVTSDKDYFPSQSMNQTVQLVREKLNKIQSNVEHFEAAPSKKTRVDNRRRI
ncbi:RNA-binding protein 48-like isoform X2 [Camellia sinensis]|uniref:RNA-binding protein 48-like isoform X2 n=1 Tax=Camellia sinensis TaxID=4442 RepID=UPI001035C9E6|nr:RNA-binding protein 48-like isoform X2 [Camellia sinensis]